MDERSVSLSPLYPPKDMRNLNLKHHPGEMFNYKKQCQLVYGAKYILYVNVNECENLNQNNTEYCDNVKKTLGWKR